MGVYVDLLDDEQACFNCAGKLIIGSIIFDSFLKEVSLSMTLFLSVTLSLMAHLHYWRQTWKQGRIPIPNPMTTLYYTEHVHIAQTQTQTKIPTPYFCAVQKSESKSVPVSISGNVNETLDLSLSLCVYCSAPSPLLVHFCLCLSVSLFLSLDFFSSHFFLSVPLSVSLTRKHDCLQVGGVWSK